MPNSGLILVTDIKIDTNRRQVFKSDERIRLTGMEFSLRAFGKQVRRAI